MGYMSADAMQQLKKGCKLNNDEKLKDLNLQPQVERRDDTSTIQPTTIFQVEYNDTNF